MTKSEIPTKKRCKIVSPIQKLDQELDRIRHDNPGEVCEHLASREVKKAHKKSVEKTIAIETEYGDLLNRSKEDVYPLKWMVKNRGIEETSKKYPKLIPLLNYIYNLNRRRRERLEYYIENLKGQTTIPAKLSTLKRLRELNQALKIKKGHSVKRIRRVKIRSDKDYKGSKMSKPWPYSLIIVNRAFYERAAKKLECSPAMIKKIVAEFKKGGILKDMGIRYNGKRNRFNLVADGYFSASEDDQYLTKHPFLKNEKRFRRFLIGVNLK